ncbi:hypothetical protein AB0F81_25900 [Actinoplanes sp. NPDC024001]|uniref:hypothetical protein n=1 Tax=Actinoplanes sp. NPDC024001 TaxID=3154598 RepID=UPI0033CFA56E
MSHDNPHLGSPSPVDDDPWRELRPTRWSTLGLGFVMLLTAAGLVTAVSTAVTGDFGTTVFLLLASLFFLHVTGLSLATRRYPRGSARPTLATIDDGSTGLTFFFRRSMYYWTASFLTLLSLGLVLLALVLLPELMVVTIVLLLLALVPAAVVFLMLRRGRGQVTLTPDGVFHKGLAFTYFAPWHAVLKVSPSEHQRSPMIAVTAAPAKETRTQRPMPSGFAGWEQRFYPMMAIMAQWLGSDPAVVYYTLRHYHETPEHRPELALSNAVDRVNQRRFLLR